MPLSDGGIRASLEVKLATLKSAHLKIALVHSARLVSAAARDAQGR